jgi:hypothetical protein
LIKPLWHDEQTVEPIVVWSKVAFRKDVNPPVLAWVWQEMHEAVVGIWELDLVVTPVYVFDVS